MDARREHDDVRLANAGRRAMAQDAQQPARVVVDRANFVVAKHVRETALEHRAILEHVRDPRGGAAIVLEHQERSVFVTNEVDSRDVDVDVAGDVDADHLGAKALRRIDDLSRDAPLAQDPLVVVNVVQERIERANPLHDSAIDPVPLGGGQDARDDVEREDSFGSRCLRVHRERHAALQEHGVDRLYARQDFVAGERRERRHQLRVVFARASIGEEQFVVLRRTCIGGIHPEAAGVGSAAGRRRRARTVVSTKPGHSRAFSVAGVHSRSGSTP